MYIGDSTCYQLESDCLEVQSPVQKQQVGWRDGNRINMSSCCCCELHPLRLERIELQQVQHVTTCCIFGHSKKDFKLSQNGLMSRRSKKHDSFRRGRRSRTSTTCCSISSDSCNKRWSSLRMRSRRRLADQGDGTERTCF